ncbi:hypothetical protein SAV14893_062010 [Streptomyces avermitilis]|uniref:Polymerase/histidinol phosphatase N-terminal domain-containing protein n=1 Tax=Streptomyces avermitilis TaxID=33903 RepID=A0A4D4M4Q3_STRAX|nr:hypothetical protein SAV14893_062010 [Streptomyces avermitilis]
MFDSPGEGARVRQVREVCVPGFTHLHTVSGFSPRYGASHPERLAERASERGMDALALTDRDTLAGTVRFAKACAAAGVRPLFGAELMVASAGEREHGGKRRAPVRGGAFIDESTPRVTFLAREGAAGWADLCRIVTASHTGEGQPLLPWPDNHAEGLTVLLGPASDVGRALAAGRPDRAARLLAPWREVYGDALRLEAVWHGRKGTGPGSLRLAARTVGFAAEQRVRPVLSNAVRYADPGMGPVADVLDAARRLVPSTPPRSWTPARPGSRTRTPCWAPPSGSSRPRATAGTPRTACSNRPRPPPPSVSSTPRTTSASGPSTSPSRTSSAPAAAPRSVC